MPLSESAFIHWLNTHATETHTRAVSGLSGVIRIAWRKFFAIAEHCDPTGDRSRDARKWVVRVTIRRRAHSLGQALPPAEEHGAAGTMRQALALLLAYVSQYQLAQREGAGVLISVTAPHVMHHWSGPPSAFVSAFNDFPFADVDPREEAAPMEPAGCKQTTLWGSVVAFLAMLALAGCGETRDPSAGPGGIHRGDSLDAVTAANPGWKLEGREILPSTTADRVEVFHFRDYHWTYSAGFLHAADHPSVTLVNGAVVSWTAKDD